MTSRAPKGSGPGALLAGAVLALPLGLGAAWLAWERSPLGLWETRTLRGYALLLSVALLAAGVRSFAGRRWRAGGTAVGVLLLLASGSAALHFRFHGWLSLGEGEPGASYASVERGPGGAPPRAAVTYAAAEEEGRHALTVAGRTSLVSPDEWVIRPGIAVRLSEAHVAPAFTLAQDDGRVEDQLLVKLSPSDPPGRSFQMSVLPYRFFTTVDASGRIALRVMRGKLTVARGTIAPGESLAFEGFRLSCRDGAPWAVLEVWSVPSRVFLPLLAGLVLLAACALLPSRVRGAEEVEAAPADSPGTEGRDDG